MSLNTIYLYIILKRKIQPASQTERLNTIYLYIILKPTTVYTYFFFLCLNTIYLYIILKLSDGQ